MAECVWDDENWSALIHAIHQRRCILFLGPEASQEMHSGRSIPCTEVLAMELSEKIKDNIDSWNIHLDTLNLAQVSQYFTMIKDRFVLEAKVSEFYASRHDSISELHNNLSELPFPLTILTTPDLMFFNSLKAVNKTPMIRRHHFRDTNEKLISEGTVDKPLIYYLYGTVDEPNSLVLTEDDILDLFVKVLMQESLPINIKDMLREKNRSLLFIGFGFKYWYLRVLLHILKIRSRGNRSFALEHEMPQNISEFERTVIFFKESDYQIHLFKEDIIQFTKELRKKYEKYKTCTIDTVADTERREYDRMPTIFLCYTNEDKVKAEDLYKALKLNGNNPWIDSHGLRGGDDWDKHIQRTIKEIDYFLVLNSKSLINKNEGYVYDEIFSAMKRHRSFKRGLRFIIPLKIDECDVLEELEYLHCIDLKSDHNINALIKTIEKDWERRNREVR